MNERFVKCHLESQGLGVKHVSKPLCPKWHRRDKGECDIVVYLIEYDWIRLFSAPFAPSENQLPPVFVWFPVLHSPGAGRLLLSQGFPTWIWSQLPALACFWELSGADKGLAEFAHSFESRGLSETQSACGRPLETLSHVGPKENICVCVFALVLRTKHPFLTWCVPAP